MALFLAIAAGSVTESATARDVFNPELLELDNPGAGKIDLTLFEAGSQAPGVYHVDIVVDGEQVDTQDITFTATPHGQGEVALQPCLTLEQLKQWGVRTVLFPKLASGGECVDLDAIPQASSEFQFSTQRLLITVPQAALAPQARGTVPPEQWDEGINAAMLNYSVSGANSWQRGANGRTDDAQYANLRPGINVGPWRLRNYTTFSRSSAGEEKWSTVYTYLQRSVIPFKAQFTAGDSTAPSDVFDSMPFRGLQLASDDEMQPDSLKGYAPVVRGIARTNAQIVVRQNGYQIYQTYVSPGAFEITDMYPTGGAGDLDVTVKEADGSDQHFTVPFASLPVLQREGRLKYAMTGGVYRSYDSQVEKTPFAQGTAIYGLPHGFTLYGGLQTSGKYQSLATGLGTNMGAVGALSLDVTQAWSKPKSEASTSGQSWRARYSKNIPTTGTNFAIAGYRYSTSGYYAMQEVLDTYSSSAVSIDRRRNRAELTMSQSLGQTLGMVMVSAIRENYWNSNRTMASWSLGYSNSWEGINYALTWTWSKNGSAASQGERKYYDKDQQVALNISIPLSKFLPQTWANYGVSSSQHNGTTQSVSLSGMAMENNALNWSVQQGYGTQGVGNSGSVNGDYKGTYGEVNAGYSYDPSQNRLNYGLQGGILAHADGMTFSQPLGETNVLIKAPGAKGVGIQNQPGAKTDWRGYSTVSNLAVYRRNDVALLADSLPDDVEVSLTNRTVIPTRGAVVRADYQVSVGLRILMTLTTSAGKYLPFGTVVSTVNKENAAQFIVGDQGQVYLTGLDARGTLQAVWGESNSEKCSFTYSVADKPASANIIQQRAVCQ